MPKVVVAADRGPVVAQAVPELKSEPKQQEVNLKPTKPLRIVLLDMPGFDSAGVDDKSYTSLADQFTDKVESLLSGKINITEFKEQINYDQLSKSDQEKVLKEIKTQQAERTQQIEAKKQEVDSLEGEINKVQSDSKQALQELDTEMEKLEEEKNNKFNEKTEQETIAGDLSEYTDIGLFLLGNTNNSLEKEIKDMEKDLKRAMDSSATATSDKDNNSNKRSELRAAVATNEKKLKELTERKQNTGVTSTVDAKSLDEEYKELDEKLTKSKPQTQMMLKN